MPIGNANFQSAVQSAISGLDALAGNRPAAAAPAPFPSQPAPVGPLMAPPVTPGLPGNPPSMPSARIQANAPIPPDTLEIGGQFFGKGVMMGDIRALADGIKPEDAAAITANDGLDKIYFTDESGKNYVFFCEKGHFEDVRAGYLGRYNGQRIKVVVVDDEANTFNEGVKSVWSWLNSTLNQSFGSEASKSISGLVATSIGSFIAAAAIKTTAPVTAVTLPAAKGFLEGVGNAAVGAVSSFLNTMASVVLFAVGAVGAVSLLQGVRAYYKKGDYRKLDMVTGNY